MQSTEFKLMGRGCQCRSGKYRVQAQEIMGRAMNARVQDTILSLQNSKEAIASNASRTGL